MPIVPKAQRHDVVLCYKPFFFPYNNLPDKTSIVLTNNKPVNAKFYMAFEMLVELTVIQ